MSAVREYFGGRVKLIYGDAYDLVMDGTYVDYDMVTDPEYDFDNRGGGRFRKARPAQDEIARDLTGGFDEAILSWKFARAIIVFCHNDQIPVIWTRLAQGFERVVLCAWHKTNPMPMANKHYKADTEFYFHAWNRRTKGWPIGDLADKARYIVTPNGAQKDFDHKTVKPQAVMEKIIRNVRGPVVDPFMGTASTGVACVRYGRPFVGIERNRQWFDVACGRIDAIEKTRGFAWGISGHGA